MVWLNSTRVYIKIYVMVKLARIQDRLCDKPIYHDTVLENRLYCIHYRRICLSLEIYLVTAPSQQCQHILSWNNSVSERINISHMTSLISGLEQRVDICLSSTRVR